MDFLKAFLRNLLFLAVFGTILLVIFPDVMRQVFELYGALFGPVAILLVIAVALPRRSNRRY